jgi:MSHA biogenesis protein MshI
MAVDLQPAGVRTAHVVRMPTGRPRLGLLQHAVRAGSDVDDLLALRRAIGLQRYRCTTSADRGSYQIVQTSAPAVSAAEMNAALRWSVKDSLDFAVDDALVDSLPVPADGAPAGRAPLVLAVAARRDRIAARVRAFQRAGIGLKVVDIAEAAQRNLAALFEQPDRALAFLSFGEHGGLLTFTRNGELYALRQIDVTAPALVAGTAEARQHLYERVTLELQRSLDNFDRLFSQLSLQRLVVAPFAGAAELIVYLRGNLAPPVEAGDLAGLLDCEAGVALGDARAQAAWLRPIGLALRNEDTA